MSEQTTKTTTLLLFEAYSGGRWDETAEGPLFVKPKWGHPYDTVREHLDGAVTAYAKYYGIEPGELDNAYRVTVWTGVDPFGAPVDLMAARPDAMVVWRKPDTTLLDAAVKVAAVEWRKHTDSPVGSLRGITRSRYDGAFKAAQAVYDAHRDLTGARGPDLTDLIETASALLPDHR